MRAPRDLWIDFWMARSGLGRGGRLATRLATWAVPRFRGRRLLAQRSVHGFVSPEADIVCNDLRLGAHCFVDDDVVIYNRSGGRHVTLCDSAHLYRGTIVEAGQGGCVEIGAHTHIQSYCQLVAWVGSIRIGREVQIAPACAFYPYEHGIVAGQPISRQPLHSSGDIVIEDGAWLGYGVIVLDGVTIGEGAVVGAGAVVTHSVPAGAIVAGVPATVLGQRT